METFESRERGFESAFAHDEALAFRIRFAALRKLGQWAEADPESLLARALAGADDETLLNALAAERPDLSAHRLRARLAAFMQEAGREAHG